MKRFLLVVVLCLLASMIGSLCNAQLINYGRHNRFLRAINSEISEENSIPQWAKELPDVQTAEERRFDINRDGKLQSAEVKVYLRGVIDQVEKRSYVNVTNDILREYDKNKDGVINTIEIELMKQHVKQ